MSSEEVLFNEVELCCALEFNEVMFKRVCLGLNPKREVLCLSSKVFV